MKLTLCLFLISLLASKSVWAAPEVNLRPLSKGEPAPYAGTLVDDNSLREIYVQMAQGDACQQKLYNLPTCSSAPSGLTHVAYFFMGALIGGVVTLAVAK